MIPLQPEDEEPPEKRRFQVVRQKRRPTVSLEPEGRQHRRRPRQAPSQSPAPPKQVQLDLSLVTLRCECGYTRQLPKEEVDGRERCPDCFEELEVHEEG